MANAIKYVRGDLLKSDDKVIAHCANCFCVMGAGVALAIQNKYQRAYEADQATKRGDRTKLGSYSVSAGEPRIYNLYGQYSFGSSYGPAIRYDALRKAMQAMAADLRHDAYQGSIGLPRLGAGLAGGSWAMIEKIITDELLDWPVTVYSL